MLLQVNKLLQQVRPDYLPLLREFLERCVICSVMLDAAADHAMHTCRRLRAVMEFRHDQGREALKLHMRLKFNDKTTCWTCFSPWWVCVDYKICPQHSAARKRLITTSLAIAWETCSSTDTCCLAREESGAPMGATASKIREWYGQHADPSARKYYFVSNAAVVLLNLWSALLAQADVSSSHHPLAKRACYGV